MIDVKTGTKLISRNCQNTGTQGSFGKNRTRDYYSALIAVWNSRLSYGASATTGRPDIREFKINDATAATTPQNLHT